MAAIDSPAIIMTSDIPVLEPIEKEREQEPGVAKAICTWEAVNRIREEGGVMEATTPGLFMMIDGEKEYKTFLEMVQDQPQQPDPVFKEGDVIPTIEDAGFPLDRQDEIDAEFKKMYDEMFSRSSELGVMGAGDFEGYLSQRKQAYNEMFRQNELSEGKIENLNGGGTNVLLKRRSSIHETQCPTTPFHTPVSISSAGSFAPSLEEGSNENDEHTHDGGSRSYLDKGQSL
jgi:hypothetical protein